MLPATSLINRIVARYPAELQEQLRGDLLELLNRDRSYMAGQIQMRMADYCGSRITLNELRRKIDQILLSPADECDYLSS
mgnify:CR=1 FL=1